MIPPHIVAEMEALAARPDDSIDYSDIPEVTDFAGFRNARGEWLVRDREHVMTVPAELAAWFQAHAPAGEDWRAGAARALGDWVARAEREAA